MGTSPPPDDPDAELVPDDLLEEPVADLDEIDELTARTVGDAAGDDQIDTSRIPGIDSGAGVAEGFEESEAQLIANATGFNDGGTERILEDAFPPEAESDDAVYGEADEEDVSEDE
jgi:hypothetical protein